MITLGPCPDCGGTGRAVGFGFMWCYGCGGKGTRLAYVVKKLKEFLQELISEVFK